MNYKTYLQSSEWEHKRIEAFKAWGFECSGCGCKNRLQVHHLSYARIGKEEMGDLMPLCPSCHEFIHKHGLTGEIRDAARGAVPSIILRVKETLKVANAPAMALREAEKKLERERRAQYVERVAFHVASKKERKAMRREAKRLKRLKSKGLLAPGFSTKPKVSGKYYETYRDMCQSPATYRPKVSY